MITDHTNTVAHFWPKNTSKASKNLPPGLPSSASSGSGTSLSVVAGTPVLCGSSLLTEISLHSWELANRFLPFIFLLCHNECVKECGQP